MAAGLQGHIHGRPGGGFAGLLQRDNLSMSLAGGLSPALADDAAVLDEHGAHGGVRTADPQSTLGQFERARHEVHLVAPAVTVRAAQK